MLESARQVKCSSPIDLQPYLTSFFTVEDPDTLNTLELWKKQERALPVLATLAHDLPTASISTATFE